MVKIKKYLFVYIVAIICNFCYGAVGNAVHESIPIIQKGDRLVIVGDSITEQRKYSVDMEAYLTVCTPEYNLWIMNMGWGGERAGGFWKRINRDLLPFNPTVITVCYGMNDGGYSDYNENIGNIYRKGMQGIVDWAKKNEVKVIVGSPGVVDSYSFKVLSPDIYNENLDKLTEIAGEIAIQNGFWFVNIHKIMINAMKKAKKKFGENYIFAGKDGIHPDTNGHLVMSYAFLKGMGFNGNLAAYTIDMKNGKVNVTNGHKVISVNKDKNSITVEYESTQYPFCFIDTQGKVGRRREILSCIPFNNDLNRFILKVKNLKTPYASVTWGVESKKYTAVQLEKGINLADEFLDNPFYSSFLKIYDAIEKKQRVDIYIVQKYFIDLEQVSSNSEKREFLEKKGITKSCLISKQALVRQEIKELLVPVKHKIKIDLLDQSRR